MEKSKKITIASIISIVIVAIGLLVVLLPGRGKEHFIIGTYGENLYKADFNGRKFSVTQVVPAVDPSYVLVNGENLYAVSEHDPEAGIYSFKNTELTGYTRDIGGSPCYLMQVPGNDEVLTADYGGGSISVFETMNGAITKRIQKVLYSGSGPVPGRQNTAHIHQLKSLPAELCSAAGISGRWLLASDLGCDCIHVLGVGVSSDSLLTDFPQLAIPAGAGSGPRHMEFNLASGLLYCLTELSGEVIVWKVGANAEGQPAFSEIQRIKADEVDAGGSADIHMSPDGKFLYTSHRLENDGVSVFSVAQDGTLAKTDYTLTGIHPRNFLISKDGKLMFVACRDSNCVQIFKIKKNGSLKLKKHPLVLGDKPVCIIYDSI